MAVSEMSDQVLHRRVHRNNTLRGIQRHNLHRIWLLASISTSQQTRRGRSRASGGAIIRILYPPFRKSRLAGTASEVRPTVYGGPESEDPAPFVAMGVRTTRITTIAPEERLDRPLSRFAILDGHSACIGSPSFPSAIRRTCTLSWSLRPVP